MITDTLEGRVKLAYARGKSDMDIAAQENISIETVAYILENSKFPINITKIIIL